MPFLNKPIPSWFQQRWRENIRLRHTVILSVIVLLIMGIGSAVMIYEQGKTIRKAAEVRGLAFSRSFALIGAAAVLDNLFRIQEAMSQYLQPDILQLEVIDPDNMIVAAKGSERIGSVLSDQDWLTKMKSDTEVTIYSQNEKGEPILVIVEPLFDNQSVAFRGGKIAAWVRTVFSLTQVRQEELQAMKRMVLVTLALMAAGIIGIQFAQRQVSHVFRGIIGQLQGALARLSASELQEPAAAVDAAGIPQSPQPGQGELEHLTEVVTQTTSLLRSQAEALRESEMKFRSVAQSASDAIIAANSSGYIISWNTGAKAIFGYGEEEMLGKPITLLMPERYGGDHLRGIERIRLTGESRIIGKTLELAGVRKDGTEFPLELSLAAWKTGEGTFYSAIIRDITERKRAEAALQALTVSLEEKVKERTAELEIARDQALSATRHKSEFLASMSHELRTPLNAVIGFSEVLLERMFGELNQKQEEYLQDILSSGRHLHALINDILDLSKVESGHMELELTTFHLPMALENTLTLMRQRAQSHGIDLTLEIDKRLGEWTADERKVKQILLNLLSNAVKFTPEGGKVTVRAAIIDNAVEISVADTGIGIAREDQQKIFEEFYQARGDTWKLEGTGLGLALAKKFVGLHGGRIWVDSEVGRGSTFTFTLPVRAPVERLSVPVVETPAFQRERPLALVVEDDPSAAKLLSIYLTEAGFAVEVASDAEAGLDKARVFRPAIITLDILMPRVDGWDFLARLKADRATASIPVVIVSIVDEPGRGFALGAAEYLVKPVDREELMSAIRRVTRVAVSERRHVTILVVDDDPIVLELMDAVLGPEGFTVLKAAGGMEGLSLARQHHPDLIVLDLLMPNIDGFQVLDELKHDALTSGIPIVVLTCKTLTPEERDRLNGRISDLKHKGEFSRADFVAQLRSLLNLGHS